MFKSSLFTFFGTLLLLLTGCASPTKMAFNNDSAKALESGNPIYLMTANLKNVYKTDYQPELSVVHVVRGEANTSSDRLNFVIDDNAKFETDDPIVGNSYYLSMELPEGNYTINGLTSRSSSFPIHGYFYTPINHDLKAEGNSIYYLGHVEAIVRERVGDEFRAGSVIPLLDQSVSGASGGTFDIEITDNWIQDRKQFLSKFPMLEGQTITKAILPEFDREKAQKMWEGE
ncbi:hypothetical protein OA92_15785 [Marinomonas sp. SBI22]|uniref:hypothetical protein n=1 Tax=unclassified Marinomonas TaxID=196814 RepID=UPI0007AF2A38|nr:MULTISPECIES: hypothetical protein [unclassified Marinomonas]KZM41026.1 hypothetical protein OA92_15785 [Marinomonas sp. SBI22]KZM42866.1 hypothetical protein OA91_13985 [Marinomonas sp. SBI8L]